MFSARRKLDGQIVIAYLERKLNGPFACPTCNEEVVLKTGRNRINHFAHVNPIACKFAKAESDAHRRCKMEIFEALQREPGVSDVALECPRGLVRPDVSATIRGVPVAIEVQLSSLSLEALQRRTIEYARNGIYVLWLLQWTPELDSHRYAPTVWEKWIHALYFGSAYYWLDGLNVASYRFDPHFESVPKSSWYSTDGKNVTAGGYSRRSKRYRTPVSDSSLNIVVDFEPRERTWWSSKRLVLPEAKLLLPKRGLKSGTANRVNPYISRISGSSGCQ